MEQYGCQASIIRDRINNGTSMCPAREYPHMLFKCGLLFAQLRDINKVFTFSETLEFLHAGDKLTETTYDMLLSFMYENPDLYREVNEILDKVISCRPVNILMELEKLDALKPEPEGKKLQISPDESKTHEQVSDQRREEAQLLGGTGTLVMQEPNNESNSAVVDNISQKTEKYDDEALDRIHNQFLQSEALAKKLQQQQQNLAGTQKMDDDTLCDICYVGLYDEEFLPLQSCDHIFHKNCLAEYFKAEISENRFPLKCANDKCKAQIKDHDIKQILASDLYSKYEKHTLKHYADMHGDSISWCPTANCEYMFFFEKDDQVRFQCLECHKQYCLNCRVEWHKDMTCKEYKISNTHSSEDDAFVKFVTGKKFKQCPKCKFWVEKNEGCDHMTCKCKFEFCYKCGGVYMKCECMEKAKEQMERRRQKQVQRAKKRQQAAERRRQKMAAPQEEKKQTRSRRRG